MSTEKYDSLIIANLRVDKILLTKALKKVMAFNGHVVGTCPYSFKGHDGYQRTE